MQRKSWDKYYFDIAEQVAERSPCLSRKIGAILVRDKIVICEGYNGPARGVPACGKDRLVLDHIIRHRIENDALSPIQGSSNNCPRYQLGFGSGGGLHLCPAVHAEANCVASAARLGIVTLNTTMYLTSGLPCKDCLSLIINAGVQEVVVTKIVYYDELTSYIEKTSVSNIKIRTYIKEN